MKHIRVWTDGSCLRPGGPGGVGFLIRWPDGIEERESSGFAATTNQRMELMAAIHALESICDVVDPIILVTDSKYLQLGITEWLPVWKRRGWFNARGKPISNRDLWERLERAVRFLDIKWKHVRGHRGNKGNEIADKLAGIAARANPQAPDIGFEARGW